MAHQVIANENWKRDVFREDSLADVVRLALNQMIVRNGSVPKTLLAKAGIRALPLIERAIRRSSLPYDIKEQLIGEPSNPLYGCADVTYYRWPDLEEHNQIPPENCFLAHIRYWEMKHNEMVYVEAVVKKSNGGMEQENRGALLNDSQLFTLRNSENPKRDAAMYAVEKRKLIDSTFFK
ncbi:hypothetical protein D6774_03260 [Candidatus Woesearchaeota archaeon]|nr:MAG: hypothetical protein D6774_03260 [Candidatus Woesearchaeota archaeon]